MVNFFIFLFFLVFNVNANNLPSDYIYNLDSNLLEYNGSKLKLSELKGNVQVFSMIYTNCKTVCPIIINNMKLIEKMIPESISNNVGFFLISLDPERDDVDILNIFFKEKNLNVNKWRLFKTTKEETLKIALTTGIKYKKEKNNEYTHSNLILVLDKNGVIKLYQQGLDKNYTNLIELIKKLSY